MVEMEERETLLRSLKGYLSDLAESGVDELAFAQQSPVPVQSAGPAEPERGTMKPAPVSDCDSNPQPECRQEGDPRARLLFLMTGAGFAGAAGELLEKIVTAMGFRRDEICLLSFDFGSEESAGRLRSDLESRIAAVAPEVVVTLGEQACGLLLQKNVALERLRGQFHPFKNFQVMPTFHPDAMLANEALKRDVWGDMKQVMQQLGKGA